MRKLALTLAPLLLSGAILAHDEDRPDAVEIEQADSVQTYRVGRLVCRKLNKALDHIWKGTTYGDYAKSGDVGEVTTSDDEKFLDVRFAYRSIRQAWGEYTDITIHSENGPVYVKLRSTERENSEKRLCDCIPTRIEQDEKYFTPLRVGAPFKYCKEAAQLLRHAE